MNVEKQRDLRNETDRKEEREQDREKQRQEHIVRTEGSQPQEGSLRFCNYIENIILNKG